MVLTGCIEKFSIFYEKSGNTLQRASPLKKTGYAKNYDRASHAKVLGSTYGNVISEDRKSSPTGALRASPLKKAGYTKNYARAIG